MISLYLPLHQSKLNVDICMSDKWMKMVAKDGIFSFTSCLFPWLVVINDNIFLIYNGLFKSDFVCSPTNSLYLIISFLLLYYCSDFYHLTYLFAYQDANSNYYPEMVPKNNIIMIKFFLV